MFETIDYEPQLLDILESSIYQFSDIKPSLWYEENMVMPSGSAFPGPFRFKLTPYWREPLDCMAKDHPAKIIAIMKGAQTGCSTSVLTPAVGYTISQNPGNILFLTGHADLSEEAVVKLDYMIDNCGLRPLIRPSILRAKNSRTGDTNKSKEYPGGTLVAGSAGNEKLLRQRDIMVCIADDIDAAKTSSKSAGNTRSMIEQRLAAYYHKMKLYYVSTPELKESSNIEPAFLLGDQRYYHVPCPCCGEFIKLEWSVPLENSENEMAGISYKLDEHSKLIPESVGYICQKCGSFFDDSVKMDILTHGKWIPTAKPSKEGYYSYHLSSLYAPHGMYDWKYYVEKYLEANPPDQPQKVEEMKAFTNLVLGLTWEDTGEVLNANELQKNIRNYECETIPESLSLKDGNGRIVLLTCAADLNGKIEDARLDYEVTAWSETGSSYSITHGSIGTFIPNEGNKKNKEDREKWTYEHNKPNSVWRLFDELLGTIYNTDTGRRLKIYITGLDTGYCELEAFTYIDKSNYAIVGLKGDKVDKFVRKDIDLPNFKVGASRNNLFILRVNQLKDDLAYLMKLKWDIKSGDDQPAGFINYPVPDGDKYQYRTYFQHFEAEVKKVDKDGNFVWQKKNSIVQNHLFDCRIYNMAIKEILVFLWGKEKKNRAYDWLDFCRDVLPPLN